MDFDSPDLQTCRSRRTLKWSKNPEAIGAWVAEMDYLPCPQIRNALHTAIEDNMLGYPPAGIDREAADAMRRFSSDTFGWDLLPEQVHLSRDVLSVLRGVIELTDPASPVIVPTPAYFPFLTIPQTMGRPVIEIPSARDDTGRWRLNLPAITKAARAAKGRGVFVFCNPWNPTGVAFRAAELQELSATLAEFPELLIFNDEIHSPLAHSAPHLPLVRVCPELATRTVTATAASKGWNIPGLHCAQWIITDEELSARAADTLSFAGGYPAALGALSARVAYDEGRQWLAEAKERIKTNIAAVAAATAASKLEISLPEATYLSFWHVPGVKNPAKILEENGLLVNDGATMGAGWENYFRLNLACSEEVLAEILHIIDVSF